jgi:transposase
VIAWSYLDTNYQEEHPMNNHKYVALDVHQSSIVLLVVDQTGKQIQQSILETRADTVADFFKGLSGTIHATFEEGTHSDWLFDIINPLVSDLIVCNPRHNHLLKAGSKSDKIDTKKLADLLRGGLLKPVYHGPASTRSLKELVHCYDALVSDTTRVMNRLKARFRSQAIACSGRSVYQPSKREYWVGLISEPATQCRVELLYRELDMLKELKREASKKMIEEARKHPAYKILKQVPGLGPVRVAQILAAACSPHRFRTKRQWWSYCGLAVVSRTSADYQIIEGQIVKNQKPGQTRGLNWNHNHRLKQVFKSAALESLKQEQMKSYYEQQRARGLRAEIARVQVARKLAAITLAVWKKREDFDAERMMRQTA